MLGCIEHKVRNISYMHPNQKIEFYDFSGKIDQPMWIAAVFEWMNEPVDSNNDKFKERMFSSKPVAKGYNIGKNLDFDNLNLQKDGCKPTRLWSLCDYHKFFGEDSVEWFLKELVEKDTLLKKYVKIHTELGFNTMPENIDSADNFGLCD